MPFVIFFSLTPHPPTKFIDRMNGDADHHRDEQDQQPNTDEILHFFWSRVKAPAQQCRRDADEDTQYQRRQECGQRRLKIAPKTPQQTLNHRCPSFLSKYTIGRRTQSRPAIQPPPTEKSRQKWRQSQMSQHNGRQSLPIYLPLPALLERLNEKRYQNAERDKHYHAAPCHQQTKQKNQKINHTYLQKRDIQIIADNPAPQTKRLRITRIAGKKAPITKSNAMISIAKRILTKTFIIFLLQSCYK